MFALIYKKNVMNVQGQRGSPSPSLNAVKYTSIAWIVLSIESANMVKKKIMNKIMTPVSTFFFQLKLSLNIFLSFCSSNLKKKKTLYPIIY